MYIRLWYIYSVGEKNYITDLNILKELYDKVKL